MYHIRPERPDDTSQRRTAICRRCWHASYSHLLSAAAIDAVFDGKEVLAGSWLSRRSGLLGRGYAEVDGTTVGFVEVGELSGPGSGEISALYVLPEYQGRGAGRALWDEGCRMLFGAGYETAEVWALTGAAAIDFYRAMGCQEFATGVMRVGRQDVAVTGLRYEIKDSGVQQ
jgi:ribosomal protein S18 acetylase RimI-like enzyme